MSEHIQGIARERGVRRYVNINQVADGEWVNHD
jgi:hypothetical protein